MNSKILIALFLAVGITSNCKNNTQKSSVKTLDDLAGLGSGACDAATVVNNSTLHPQLRSGNAISGDPDSVALVKQQLARIPIGLQNLYFSDFQGTMKVLGSADFQKIYQQNHNGKSAPSGLAAFRDDTMPAGTGPIIYLDSNPADLKKSVIRSISFFFSEQYIPTGNGQIAFYGTVNIDQLKTSFVQDLDKIPGYDKCQQFGSVLVRECGLLPPGKNLQIIPSLSSTPEMWAANLGRVVLAEAMDSYYCSKASLTSFQTRFSNTWMTFQPIKAQLDAQFGVVKSGTVAAPKAASASMTSQHVKGATLDDGGLPGENNEPVPVNSDPMNQSQVNAAENNMPANGPGGGAQQQPVNGDPMNQAQIDAAERNMPNMNNPDASNFIDFPGGTVDTSQKPDLDSMTASTPSRLQSDLVDTLKRQSVSSSAPTSNDLVNSLKTPGVSKDDLVNSLKTPGVSKDDLVNSLKTPLSSDDLLKSLKSPSGEVSDNATTSANNQSKPYGPGINEGWKSTKDYLIDNSKSISGTVQTPDGQTAQKINGGGFSYGDHSMWRPDANGMLRGYGPGGNPLDAYATLDKASGQYLYSNSQSGGFGCPYGYQYQNGICNSTGAAGMKVNAQGCPQGYVLYTDGACRPGRPVQQNQGQQSLGQQGASQQGPSSNYTAQGCPMGYILYTDGYCRPGSQPQGNQMQNGGGQQQFGGGQQQNGGGMQGRPTCQNGQRMIGGVCRNIQQQQNFKGFR